ncbi:MAG: rRNA processing protein [Alectoria sarmentosa]|nr:MAG: rRNA processing protein [Alectoria sarmentosa]
MHCDQGVTPPIPVPRSKQRPPERAMGSSRKRKNEKRKDFKKPKLKVGKARTKPDNFTDTSFKAKGRHMLKTLSLTTIAPTQSLQFSHHLSLLSSRSSSQRRDSLAYLTTAITSRPVTIPLLQPVSALLPRLNPLILDGSHGVRSQLLKLFSILPSRETDPHIKHTLLYIRAGLTHLAADIRSSATDLLLWAIETCPNELVSCAGGWVKTLKCLLTVLHWHAPSITIGTGAAVGANAWSSSRAPTLGKEGSEGKLTVKTLRVLTTFLRAGLMEEHNAHADATCAEKWPFPLRYVEAHMLPKRSNTFAHLNLFGPPRDEESEMYAEREERQRIFHERFYVVVSGGVEAAKREGGEVGRAAAGVAKVLVEGMEGFGRGK